MVRPPKSQVLLEVKATEKADASPGKGEKRHLIVTAHRLWIDEGHEILLADLLSVRLSASDTVSVRQIGLAKPTEFQCRKADEAQDLRACLVFHGKYTRGGIPGVETWKQLTSAPYDRIDISDATLPAGASPAVDAASAVSTVALASRGRRSTGLAVVVAVAVVGVIAVAVIHATTRSSGGNRQRGASAAQLEAARAADEALSRGDYAEAVRQYRTALEGSPRSAELLAGLGSSLVHQGKPSEAVAPLEESLTYSTKPQAEVSAMLATCYLEAKRAPEALRVLQRARRDFPDDTELDFLMAKTLSLRGPSDAAAALKLSRKVYENQPNHLANARLYASLLDGARMYREAIRVHLAVAHGAKDYASFVSAARNAGKAGRIKEASGIIAEARLMFPERAELKDKTNDQVLIGLDIMEAPPEPEPEPEPQPEPVVKEPVTQPGTGQETKTPGTETPPAKEPGSETHPGTETPPAKEPGTETHPPDGEHPETVPPGSGEERPAPPADGETVPAPPVEKKPAEGEPAEPAPAEPRG